MRPYAKYRAALYAGAAALAAGYLLIKGLPEASQPTILIFCLFGITVVAWGYACFARCPKCRLNLLRSTRARMSAGKMYQCAQCGVDLRDAA